METRPVVNLATRKSGNGWEFLREGRVVTVSSGRIPRGFENTPHNAWVSDLHGPALEYKQVLQAEGTRIVIDGKEMA